MFTQKFRDTELGLDKSTKKRYTFIIKLTGDFGLGRRSL